MTVASRSGNRLGIVLTLAAASSAAADWTNMGGNPGRNGLVDTVGPATPEVLWSGGPSSVIAWHPVIAGDTVYIVRQSGFPPSGEPNGSPIVALDLHTGAIRWQVNLPYQPGDWTTWIAGVSNGRLYAGRSGNGASVSDPLVALDAESGATLWQSDEPIDAGAYDGVVFAPDGDPIIGSFRDIWRIDAETGQTLWRTERLGSVSGTCGVALHGDRIYAVDATFGGTLLRRFDLATGAPGPEVLMPGISVTTIQNTPTVAPDGTILVSRTQNNVLTDFFFAYDDTGDALVERWRIPAQWTTRAETGVGPDGSIYMVRPGNEFVRLDPADGSVIDSAGTLPGFSSPRMAIDAEGRVYLSNGAFPTGRLSVFTADLELLWEQPVTNINIGGPALAADGTLVVAGNGTQLLAFAGGGGAPVCGGDIDGDGTTDLADLLAVLAAWGPCPGGGTCPADLDDDGQVALCDLLAVLADFNCRG